MGSYRKIVNKFSEISISGLFVVGDWAAEKKSANLHQLSHTVDVANPIDYLKKARTAHPRIEKT